MTDLRTGRGWFLSEGRTSVNFRDVPFFDFTVFYFFVSGGLIVAGAVLWKNERVNGER